MSRLALPCSRSGQCQLTGVKFIEQRAELEAPYYATGEDHGHFTRAAA